MRKPDIDKDSRRLKSALEVVLPPGTPLRFQGREGHCAEFEMGGRIARVRWVAAGWPRQIQEAINVKKARPDIIVTTQISPGARALLASERIGWVDELGAAEIFIGTIIISKTGQKRQQPSRSEQWSPSVLAVAEALLCRTAPTVEATTNATGLSSGACTNALKFLANTGHLIADAPRGPRSARRIKDENNLLEVYATAANNRAQKNKFSLEVGGTWRELQEGIAAAGKIWDKHKIAWAATGAVAAEVLAPTLTTLGSGVIYVAAETIAELDAVARRAGLEPIDGGRLTLKPFPTTSTRLLATTAAGLKVAPWPRVYVDLRTVGVRGEDAAEHLLEVIRG